MNSIVLLDKSSGCTSFEAVRTVSRIYSREKAGHSGTLDPSATGVLPIFLGRATKLISLLPVSDKAYTAAVKLGCSTDTGDADGEIISETGTIPTEKELRYAAEKLTGEIMQTPPMYSAKKQNGVPLYKLAREGKTADREACAVTVYSIEIFDYQDDSFKMNVSCSSGTYIRTLAEDLASSCGSLCHLTSLRRTSACGFSIENCFTSETLKTMAEEGRAENALISCETPFLCLPSVVLKGDLYRLFMNGFCFSAGRCGIHEKGMYRIYNGENEFIGLGNVENDSQLKKLWQAITV